MSERDEHSPDPAVERAHGKDVDGLITLPGVHSATGVEKAGTGEVDDEVGDQADDGPHVASDDYPRHPPFGGPPPRHA
jgi:hypothetical protein